MMSSLNPGAGARLRWLVLACGMAFIFSATASAQTAVATGKIGGTVTDEAGAPVPAARVTALLASVSAGTATTDLKGAFTISDLTPGNYTVSVSAKGFDVKQLQLEVKADATANGSVKLVAASDIQVDSQQATVRQNVTSAQADRILLLNGRNFMDLGAIEPGIQIADGENIAPDKAGLPDISISSRFGRGSRLSLDGVDITDETVGATTIDIPLNGIQVFSVEQSTLDVATDLTGSGAVKIRTKSGSPVLHGDFFGAFRDSKEASSQLANPFSTATESFLPTPYQRNQEGGSLGGALIKDKLFFFAAGERTLQQLTAPVFTSSPFDEFSGTVPEPFREDELQLRLDYTHSPTTRFFGRFNYFDNSLSATFFPSSYQLYDSRGNTKDAAFGADFNARNVTHSIRFSYLRMGDHLFDATSGSALPFANYPVSINIGSFTVGPNSQAPQSNLQSDKQVRYDGTKILGNHILRFGLGYNRIEAGGFQDLFASDPQVFGAFAPAFSGSAADPTAYSLSNAQVIVGNGQGFSSNRSAFGYAGGGLGPDNRLSAYIGDTWRAKPNLTLTPGVRWERDTGRTDSDVPTIPELNSAFPGWGNRVAQQNMNFGPQFGLAWDPKGDAKTVIRMGAGYYYENVLFNNTLLDRPLRERTGTYLATAPACFFGVAQPVPTATAGTITVNSAEGLDPITGQSYCADTVAQASSALAAFQSAYQADNPYSASAANPYFIGSQLASGRNILGGLFDPVYKTPRVLQTNIGFQHEVRRGTIFGADYLRSVETHSLLGVDINHTGAARFFNAVAAQTAVNMTVADCGAVSLNSAIAPGGCPGIHPASLTSGVGAATLSDFAYRGLTSPIDLGSSCLTANDPSTGLPLNIPCAFPGINPNYGVMDVLEPGGRSVYHALNLKVIQTAPNPLPAVTSATVQIVYTYSRSTGPLAFQGNTPSANPFATNDPDLVPLAADNDRPLHFNGPTMFDRANQFSFGGTFDIRYGFKFTMLGQFASPLSSPAIVGDTGTPSQIFQTDFSGSGVGSQPLPGTSNGSFMRSLGFTALNQAISRYNTNTAGEPTPAGQVLAESGIFTLPQLQTLGAVAPVVTSEPADQLVFPWVKNFDARLSWSHTFHDRFKIEPSVAVFNVFNIANFDTPPAATSGWLDEGAGSINSVHTDIQPGQTGPQSNTFRTGYGTGVFGPGAPRAFEWSLRVSF